MSTPNLFQLATKELSQDAFITWLLQWADPSYFDTDPLLNACAQDFVRKLLNESSDFKINIVEAKRQWKNTDISVKINNEIFLVIEDKKHSNEHSNQLIRYKEIAEKWCSEQDSKWKAKFAYLKTGDESKKSLSIVEDKGYKVIDRKSIISIFNLHPEITNNIFIDFNNYIVTQELNISSFRDVKTSDWQSEQWVGFYQWLQNESNIFAQDWFWVNNMSGGFWGFLLNWDWKLGDSEFKNSYPIYSQIESDKQQLCIKISLSEDDIKKSTDSYQKSEIRNSYYQQLLDKSRDKNINGIRRPNRFGNGSYMTIAVVDRKDWMAEKEGVIDMTTTLENLTMYHSFIKECTATWIENSFI